MTAYAAAIKSKIRQKKHRLKPFGFSLCFLYALSEYPLVSHAEGFADEVVELNGGSACLRGDAADLGAQGVCQELSPVNMVLAGDHGDGDILLLTAGIYDIKAVFEVFLC